MLANYIAEFVIIYITLQYTFLLPMTEHFIYLQKHNNSNTTAL